MGYLSTSGIAGSLSNAFIILPFFRLYHFELLQVLYQGTCFSIASPTVFPSLQICITLIHEKWEQCSFDVRQFDMNEAEHLFICVEVISVCMNYLFIPFVIFHLDGFFLTNFQECINQINPLGCELQFPLVIYFFNLLSCILVQRKLKRLFFKFQVVNINLLCVWILSHRKASKNLKFVYVFLQCLWFHFYT